MADHAAAARRLLASDGAEYGDQGLGQMTNALAAQAHATLALVEEQRTANLIAAWAQMSPSLRKHRDALAEQVTARLSLTPTTPNQEQ